MKRLMEKIVFSGLVTAWRLATWPTSRSPVLANATTDGVSRPPSGLVITTGSPPSITATTEFVVPRSMPIILLIESSRGHVPPVTADTDLRIKPEWDAVNLSGAMCQVLGAWCISWVPGAACEAPGTREAYNSNRQPVLPLVVRGVRMGPTCKAARAVALALVLTSLNSVDGSAQDADQTTSAPPHLAFVDGAATLEREGRA